MACIVFRQIKLGLIASDGVSSVDVHIHTSIRFLTPPEETMESEGSSIASDTVAGAGATSVGDVRNPTTNRLSNSEPV